jgi:hypothetical protein
MQDVLKSQCICLIFEAIDFVFSEWVPVEAQASVGAVEMFGTPQSLRQGVGFISVVGNSRIVVH